MNKNHSKVDGKFTSGSGGRKVKVTSVMSRAADYVKYFGKDRMGNPMKVTIHPPKTPRTVKPKTVTLPHSVASRIKVEKLFGKDRNGDPYKVTIASAYEEFFNQNHSKTDGRFSSGGGGGGGGSGLTRGTNGKFSGGASGKIIIRKAPPKAPIGPRKIRVISSSHATKTFMQHLQTAKKITRINPEDGTHNTWKGLPTLTKNPSTHSRVSVKAKGS